MLDELDDSSNDPSGQVTEISAEVAATVHSVTQPEPRSKDACTQYEPPGKRSIKTQASLKFQLSKMSTRTKSTQVTPAMKDASVSCRRISSMKEPAATSTPMRKSRKRLRLDDDEDDLSVIEDPDDHQDCDKSYSPFDISKADCGENNSLSEMKSHEGSKYLVFKECLWELFQNCPVCLHPCDIIHNTIGTFLSVTQRCVHCDFHRKWASQPMVGDIPAGNIQLSAAVSFTGSSFATVEKLFGTLQVANISSATFYTHSRKYLQPTIYWHWKESQEEILGYLTSEPEVVLGGDMRADSPGHCAKFGSYTVMELNFNRIIDIQLVQSNETGGSTKMEKEGLIRSLKFLEESGIIAQAIVTDRHPQIQKYLREEKEYLVHYYDVWHISKSIRKKLENLSKERDCETIKDWIRSIINHLYWTAGTSKSGDEAVAKWTSIVNHVQNVHDHGNMHFPTCAHPPIAQNARKWLIPHTKSSVKLSDVINKTHLLRDIRKLSPLHQTSTIEAFHSLLLKFAPKNVSFTYKGMLCRLLLAAIHFNENADRPQATDASGNPLFEIRFPKFKKGGYSLVAVKEDPTREYIKKLMDLLFSHVLLDPEPYQKLFLTVKEPAPLNFEFQRPEMTEAVASYTSRFTSSTNPGAVE